MLDAKYGKRGTDTELGHGAQGTRKGSPEGHQPSRSGGAILADEEKARKWFESLVWPTGKRDCPGCGSLNTHDCKHAKMPYRCRDCRKYFSVKIGTIMAGSPIRLRKWVYAIYLDATIPKGRFQQ